MYTHIAASAKPTGGFRRHGRRATAAILWAAALAAAAPSVLADNVSTTWNNTDGNWSDASKWSNGVPNNGTDTYSATIERGYVTMTSPVTVQDLSLGTIYNNMYTPQILGDYDLTVNGQFTMASGVLGGDALLTLNGTSSVPSTDEVMENYRTINNNGYMTWAGRQVIFSYGTINNNVGSTWKFTDEGSICGTFNNYGTLLKDSTSYHPPGGIDGTFTNPGAVQLTTGLIAFSGGGSATGSFTAASGSTITFGHPYDPSHGVSPGYQLLHGSSLTGAGNYTFYGDVPISGTINCTGAVVVSLTGTLTLNADSTPTQLGSTFNLDEGRAVMNTGSPYTFNQNVNLFRINGEGRLEGTDDLTFTGDLHFENGVLASGHTATLRGTTSTGIHRGGTFENLVVDNYGTFTLRKGGLNLDGSTFNNRAGAVFLSDLQFTESTVVGHSYASPSGALNNDGTVQSSNGGIVFFMVPFTNTGTVQTSSGGSITFGGGYTGSGAVVLDSGSAAFGYEQTSPPTQQTFSPGSSISGTGSASFPAGGTTDIYGSYTASGWTTISSTVNFQPGSNYSTPTSGSLRVNPGAQLNLNSGQPVQFYDVLLRGTIAGSDSVIINGTLSGDGTLEANLRESGTLSPGNSPGRLNVQGNLALDSAATSVIELAGRTQGSQYDYVAVDGSATLDGTLDLRLLNGLQTQLTPSDIFTIFTASSISGSFDNAPSGSRIAIDGAPGSFQIDYAPGGTAVVLSDYAVPEPNSTMFAVLCLSTAALLRPRRRPCALSSTLAVFGR